MVNKNLRDNFLLAREKSSGFFLQNLLLEMFENNADIKHFFDNYKIYLYDEINYYANENLHINLAEYIDDLRSKTDYALSTYIDDEIEIFFLLNSDETKFNAVELFRYLFEKEENKKENLFYCLSERFDEMFDIFIKHFGDYANFMRNFNAIKLKVNDEFFKFDNKLEAYYTELKDEKELIAKLGNKGYDDIEFAYDKDEKFEPTKEQIEYQKTFVDVNYGLRLKQENELIVNHFGLKSYMPPKLFDRDNEVDTIVRILSRPTNNNISLVDTTGTEYAKTAIIEGFAKKVLLREVPRKFRDKIVYKLDISELQTQKEYPEKIKNFLRNRGENAIIFVDNCNSYINKANKTNLGSLFELFRDATCVFIFSKNKLETTVDSFGVNDVETANNEEDMNAILKNLRDTLPEKIFFTKFNEIIVETLSDDEMSKILKHEIMDDICCSCGVKFDDEILKQAVKLSRNRLADDKDSVANFIYDIATKIQISQIGKPKKLIKATKQDINETFSEITNQKINISQENILNLRNYIKNEIFGQDEAVDTLCNALIRSYAGFKRDNSPIGVFLFTGNTGTGKTELARCLAKNLGFHFSRYDMSEYYSKEKAETLIGSPRGYRDSEKGGLLVNDIVNNPFSVVLFDEIEKAHPDITKLFLQIFDNATLKDGIGALTANFENTIIIMTSNLLSKEVKVSKVGFGNKNTIYKDDGIKKFFAPELLNRITKIIYFNDLDYANLDKILTKYVQDIESRMFNLKIILTKKARKFLIENNSGVEFGARKLRRALEEEVLDGLSMAKLSGKLKDGGEVIVDSDDKKIILKFRTNKS